MARPRLHPSTCRSHTSCRRGGLRISSANTALHSAGGNLLPPTLLPPTHHHHPKPQKYHHHLPKSLFIHTSLYDIHLYVVMRNSHATFHTSKHTNKRKNYFAVAPSCSLEVLLLVLSTSCRCASATSCAGLCECRSTCARRIQG